VEIQEEEVIEEEEEVIIVAEEGLPQEPKLMKAWPPMSDAVDKNLPNVIFTKLKKSSLMICSIDIDTYFLFWEASFCLQHQT
jgi:hypothetical protein